MFKNLTICILSLLGLTAPVGHFYHSAIEDEIYEFGVIDDTFEVNSLGGYNHIIPIDVPPGVNELIPTLAVSYDSRAGLSELGMGWSLAGISKIRRSGNNFAQHGRSQGITFSENDAFLLDGQYLTVVKGKNGEARSEYRTENESFRKIYALGEIDNSKASPRTFVVKLPNGTTFYYGETPTSKLDLKVADNQSEIMEWNITRIVDKNGNYIKFNYKKQAINTIRIASIEYTGNESTNTSPTNIIVFSYNENWSDARKANDNYIAGIKFRNTNVLEKIRIETNGKPFRYYHFEYDNSYSKLVKVYQSVDESNETRLHPTVMTYESFDTLKFEERNKVSVPHLNNKSSLRQDFVDIDADGVEESVVFINRKDSLFLDVFTKTNNGFSKKSSQNLGEKKYTDKKLLGYLDINGDGFADLHTKKGIYIQERTGKEIEFKFLVHTFNDGKPFSDLSGNNGEIHKNDFDGDGKHEIIILNKQGSAFPKDHSLIKLSQSGTLELVKVNNFKGPFTSARFANFRQGESQDLVIINGNNASHLTFKKSRFHYESFILPTLISPFTNSQIQFVDVNFDGLDDIMQIVPNTVIGNNKQIPISLNTGSRDGKPNYQPYIKAQIPDVVKRNVKLGNFAQSGFLELFIPQNANTFSIYSVRVEGGTINLSKESADLLQLGEYGTFNVNGSAVAVPAINFETSEDYELGDLNDDGITDFWIDVAGGASETPYKLEYSNPIKFLNKIKSVTDGFDNNVFVTYSNIKDTSIYTCTQEKLVPHYRYFNQAFEVVKSLRYSNGLTNDSTNELTYSYEDLIYENTGRGMSGFRKWKKVDSSTDIEHFQQFEYQFPFTGSLVEEYKKSPGGITFFEQTNVWDLKTYRKLSFKHQGTSFSEIVNLQNFSAQTVRYLPLLKSSSVTKRELDGQVKSKSEITLHYNDYGAITKKVTSINGKIAKHESKTYRNINQSNLPNSLYILGLLVEDRSAVEDLNSNKRTTERINKYSYYENGLLKEKQRQPDNSTFIQKTSFNYDSFGNLISSTMSGNGVDEIRETYKYSVDGRFMVNHTNGENHSTTYEIDPRFGAVVKVTDPNGNQTSSKFDQFGRLVSKILPDGTTTTFTYGFIDEGDDFFSENSNAQYKITDHTEGKSEDVTSYYDRMGREVGSVYYLLDTTKYTRAISGGSVVDIDGYIQRPVFKQAIYDNRGNVILDYKAQYLQVLYDQSNNVQCISFEDTSRAVTMFNYDLFNRITVTALPDGNNYTTEYIYDRKVETNQNGQKVTSVFNKRGDVREIIDNKNNSTLYTYNLWGDVIQISNPNSGVVNTSYDAIGRRTEFNDPNLGTIQFYYDAYDRQTSEITNGSKRINMIYDNLSRLIRKEMPETTTTWHYDGARKGLMDSVEVVDRSNLARVSVEKYSYDELGRTTKLAHALEGQSYTMSLEYDQYSRLIKKIYNGEYTVTYDYTNDALSTLSEVASDGSKTLLFKVDQVNANGDIIKKSFGNGVITDLHINLFTNLIERIHTHKLTVSSILPPQILLCTQTDSDTGSGTSLGGSSGTGIDIGDIDWDEIRRRILNGGIRPGDINPFDPFDPNDPRNGGTGFPNRRPELEKLGEENLSTLNMSGAPAIIGLDREELQDLRLVYDDNYNLEQKVDAINAEVEAYTYDKLNRLTSYKTKTDDILQDSVVLAYDAVGNITRKSDVGSYVYDSDAFQRVKFIVDQNGNQFGSYEYDEYGNVISDDVSDLKIEYASFNKPVMIEKDSLSKSLLYGSQNQLIRTYTIQSDSLVMQKRIKPFSDFEVIQEDGKQTNVYYLGINGQLVAIHRDHFVGGNKTNSSKQYIHKDYLGSVQVITDEQGNLVGEYTYDPFGQREQRFKGATVQKGFTGHEHLDEFGIINAKGRFYMASIGRFLSADPFVATPNNLQSLNRYSYVLNNPLNLIDPSGYWSLKRAFKRAVKGVSRGIRNVGRAIKKVAKGVENLAKAAAKAYVAVIEEGARFVKKYATQIIIIAAAAAITYFSGGTLAGFAGAMLQGALWGAGIGAGIAAAQGGNFQDILNAGFNGAITGAAGGSMAYAGASLAAHAGKYGKYLLGGANGYASSGGKEEGFARGVVASFVPADLGFEATKHNAWALQLGSSAARGYIIDGEDGMETQVIGNVANQTVGHAVGYLSSGGNGPAHFKDGVYVYKSNHDGSVSIGGAVTLQEDAWGSSGNIANQNLLDHEIRHYSEQNTLGAFYLPAHTPRIMFGAEHLERDPYNSNPIGGGYN